MLFPAVLVVFALAIVLISFALFRLSYWTRKRVPCDLTWSPFGTISKNVLQQKSMADVLNELYQKFSDEPFFGIFTFLTPTLVLRDLEVIKEVTVKNVDTFLTHKLFSTDDPTQAFTKNLFVCTGSVWKSTRPSLSPAFTGSKMRAMYTLVNRCSEHWRESMAQELADCRDGDVIEMEIKDDLFSRFTTDVIATCIFGLESNSFRDRDNEFFTRAVDVGDFIGVKIFSLFGYCFNRFIVNLFGLTVIPKDHETFFSNVVLNTIKMRKTTSAVRPDMVHLLMQAQQSKLKHDVDNNSIDTGFATVTESALGRQSTNDEISDMDIVGHSLLFLIAGSDTPSIALNFMAYELASNPDVQRKLHAEIKATMDTCGGQLSYEALLGMTYLDMVCSETLRKWPPLPVTDRVTQKPYTLQHNGKRVDLAEGSIVWIPTFSIHRDPKYYPDPDRFDPERFNEENRVNVKKEFYLPFGMGPKACIGSRLAMLMLKSIMVHILYDFEFVPVGRTPNPMELSKKHIFLNPDSRMWLGMKKRTH